MKADRASTALAIVGYTLCSASMMIVNKHVVRFYKLPLTVLLIQMLFATVVLGTCLRHTLAFGTTRDVLRWARAVPPLFTLMLGSGMLALRFASMGAVVVGRNVTPLLSLALEAALLRERPRATACEWATLVFVLSGAIVYIHADIGAATSTAGVAFIALNIVVATSERLVQRHLMAVDPVSTNKNAMLFINNAIGTLIVGLAVPLVPTSAYDTPEPQTWAALTPLPNVDPSEITFNHFMLLLSCIVGIAIGAAGLHVQSRVSATSFLVLINLNKVLVVAFGVVVFGEARTLPAVLGMAASLAGGAAYAALQALDEKRAMQTRYRCTGIALLVVSLAALANTIIATAMIPSGALRAPVQQQQQQPVVPLAATAPPVVVTHLGWLDPSTADIRAAAGGKHVPLFADPHRHEMFGALVHNEANDTYHYAVRINGPKEPGVGIAIYHSWYEGSAYRQHLTNPTMPWHGDGSGERDPALACVGGGEMDAPFWWVEDPRLIDFNGDILLVVTACVGETPYSNTWAMHIASVDDLRTQGCSAYVRLHAEDHFPEREKNWGPFVHDGALHFVYAWDPLLVLRCDDWRTGQCARPRDPRTGQPVPPTFSSMPHNIVHGGSPLVPIGNDQFVGFVHSRTPCMASEDRLWNTLVGLVQAPAPGSEGAAFELLYISRPLFDWRLDEPPVRNVKWSFDVAPVSIQEPCSITSVNITSDEVVITTVFMDRHNGLVQFNGVLAHAQWGASWGKDRAWFQPLRASIDEACGRWPPKPWTVTLATVAWTIIGILSLQSIVAACVTCKYWRSEFRKRHKGTAPVDDARSALCNQELD